VQRHDGQRDGQAACPLHGRRGRRADSPMSGCIDSSSLETPGGAAQVLTGHRHRLEHQLVPLPQSRLGTTAAYWPASRCRRKPAPISYCISTRCSTRTQRKRGTRRTRYFWAGEPSVGENGLYGRCTATERSARGLHGVRIRHSSASSCARRTNGVIGAPALFTSTGTAGVELLGGRSGITQVLERIGVNGVGKCSLRVERR